MIPTLCSAGGSGEGASGETASVRRGGGAVDGPPAQRGSGGQQPGDHAQVRPREDQHREVSTRKEMLLFNDALNTLYLRGERNVLFKDTLNTFYLRGEREMFYLTTCFI